MRDFGVWSVTAAALAGLAVLGWLGPPRTLRRAADHADLPLTPPGPPPWARGHRPPGWRGLVRGRLDAPPIRRRLAVGATLAAAVALAGVAFGLLSLVSGAVLISPAALLTALGLGLLEPAATRERDRRLVLETPQALDLIAACLAAGLPPRTATAAVVAVFDGPLAEDLGVVSRGVDVGLSDAMAWRLLRGHPQLGEAAVDLARAVESGSRLVETLTFYAREARSQRAAVVENAAKAVGVRCVLPMMLCFVPSFVLLGVVPAVASAFLAAVPRVF